MPRKDIWVRKEDLEKWNAIENKPRWLHGHLNKESGNLYSSAGIKAIGEQFLSLGRTSQEVIISIINEKGKHIPLNTPEGQKAEKRLNASLCEHYQPKGKCLVKGCKK